MDPKNIVFVIAHKYTLLPISYPYSSEALFWTSFCPPLYVPMPSEHAFIRR